MVLISCTTGGNGSVPKGISHWSVVSEDIKLWNRFSESGQMRAKSRSAATFCKLEAWADCVSSHEWLVADVEAGAPVDALRVSHEAMESRDADGGTEANGGACLALKSR
jgi:hypothetical protein